MSSFLLFLFIMVSEPFTLFYSPMSIVIVICMPGYKVGALNYIISPCHSPIK